MLAAGGDYSSKDITSIISIRAHDGNPWVIDRLQRLRDHYHPAPAFLIVDFGSAPQYSDILRGICANDGFDYLRIDDSGVFSLSIARNEGALAATTDLLYFTDIDFFSAPNHYQTLARYADDHDFRAIRDIVLNLPAFHLTENATGNFWQVASADRNKYLEQLGTIAMETTPEAITEFIVPYSNNFLCTRDFFHLVGGYDSVFRGHGSEDFELMIRTAHYTHHAVLPDDMVADIHKPTSPAFFGPRPYSGFRRLGEAVSFRAESRGFRAFHLWHPSPVGDPWREANDWQRNTLTASVGNYLDSPAKLAEIDHLRRGKTALCVCKDPEHYGYFLPFRALGYRLTLIPDDSDARVEAARKLIDSRAVDVFMIFNPYMKSHARFHELFLLAKERGVEVVVVERGALPSTIYYAPDVSYNDPEFQNYTAQSHPVDAHALSAADAICDKLRRGAWTLESLNTYQDTWNAYSELTAREGIRIFVPLQLSDDMAVTRFVTPTQSYADFEAAISATALLHPEITFLVKAHPLNRDSFSGAAARNVVVCRNEENVHAIIDACHATVCYNSGVGLLSLIHGKPTVTIGNAFYNVPETGWRADSFAAAVKLVADGACPAPATEVVRKLVAWLVTRKYSFFTACDLIREFEHRNSHGYKDITVTHLNWQGTSLPLGRVSVLSRVRKSSYVNGRLGLMIGTDPAWFDSTKAPARGPIKTFFLNNFKRPLRRLMRRVKPA